MNQKGFSKIGLVIVVLIVVVVGYFALNSNEEAPSDRESEAESQQDKVGGKLTEISVRKGLVEGSHPKFSNDGTRILYRLNKTGDDGLWVVGVNGSGLRKLTSEVPGGEGTFDFGWSQGDEFIFYIRSGSAPAELRIVNINTGEIKTIFTAPGEGRGFSIKSPRWLSQHQIAFIVRNEFNKLEATVQVVDVRSGEIVTPSGEVTLYFWQTKGSPEESVIASVNTLGVVKELTPGGALSVPSVAPRANSIAYSSLDGIVTMDSNGSKAKLILPNLGGGAVPVFSPDGKRLVYDKSKDDGHNVLELDIYVINTDGTGEKRLTNSGQKFASEPSWSSDGKSIVFFYRGKTDKQIAILRVE